MKSPIKLTWKTEILPILLIVFSIISSFYFFQQMPEKIPTHWNFKGEIDNWGSSLSHLLTINLVMIGMYLLFLSLPYIDPRRERYEQFKKVYHIFKNILLLFFTIILFITNLSALGYDIDVGTYIPLLVGILFIAIGNYMPKIKMNWFMGIRTPWTLSSEKTWNKTHLLGGKLFMISGLLIAIQGFIPENYRLPIFILAIAIILIGTIFGSYLIYLKTKK
jgi:immunity protein, SdpI family